MSIVLQGSTSGSVTLQEPAIAGTTVLDLPAVSGTILTTTSPKAGNVIQVVQAVSTSTVTINTLTYTDTGLSASITPSSASSKILVFVNQATYSDRSANATGFGLKLIRGSTDIFTPITDGTGPYDVYNQFSTGGNAALALRYPINYLDSPATTSSTTYKTQGRPYQGGNLYIQGTQVIILMEIAA
jgi:hypothetical protein